MHFRITTKDVIHSFWVPQFRLKTDTVPGPDHRDAHHPEQGGRWDVVCAELCGLGHSTMRQEVRVVPEGEYRTLGHQAKSSRRRWAARPRPSREPGGSQAMRYLRGVPAEVEQ